MDGNDEIEELKRQVQVLTEEIRFINEENQRIDLENSNLNEEIIVLDLQIIGARKFFKVLDSHECTRESLSARLNDFEFLRGTIDPYNEPETNRENLRAFLNNTMILLQTNKDLLKSNKDRLQKKEDRLQKKEDSWKEYKNRIRALSHQGEFDVVFLVRCCYTSCCQIHTHGYRFLSAPNLRSSNNKNQHDSLTPHLFECLDYLTTFIQILPGKRTTKETEAGTVIYRRKS